MKICFLSMSAYPLLAKKNFGSAGGTEAQLVALAKELSFNGYEVSFITYDYGQKGTTFIKNIEVIKAYRHDKTHEIRALAKFAYLYNALEKSDADIYVCSADSHGVLPIFSFINRKKFVYRIPSDKVVLKDFENFLIRLTESMDIKAASIVVAQSLFQKKKLIENFGKKSVVIKNSFKIPTTKLKKTDPPTILWAGSLSRVKQPEVFIKLTRAIPIACFEMVGGRSSHNPQLFDIIKRLALNQPNLTFHGFVPYGEIGKYFERASIFVNTSSVEGFPNTFLQSWMHHTPVVSLNVDPDGIIEKRGLGFCSKTFKKMVSDINKLLENKDLRTNIGITAREYVEKEHDIRGMVKKYIKIFEQIAN